MGDQGISPFLRIPLTDLTGGLMSHQLLGRCQKQEIAAMECIESYGLERGKRCCKHYIDDYKECHTLRKQFLRFIAMRDERERQIRCGKLTDDKKYVSPRIDAY